MTDTELDAVTRPFMTAFRRECEATTPDVLRDELSNMLHHLYRLGELARRRWAPPDKPKVDEGTFNSRVRPLVPGLLGGLWIRTFDTHDIAVVTTFSDVLSGYVTGLVGVLTWQPLAAMPFAMKDKKGRWRDYFLNLEGRPVLDTARAAFDGLSCLL